MRYFVYSLILISIFSCKPDSNNTEEPKEMVEAAVEYIDNNLPPLGQDVFDTLYNNTTFIDYLWHDLPFSVSQADPKAVKANVTFISASGMKKIPKKCKSIGRKSYQFNGDIFLDADVYYAEGCAFYIFIKDDKPIYLNTMTEDGKKFYANLIQSGMEQRQKVIDGASQGNN